ncbi:MAG: DinB family protein [Chloroflexi bacterium]|nr:DinB family protein [Chloroflexota bacterium]
MTPTHQAAIDITRASLQMLRETIDDLPDAALDWSPVAGMNSLGVLVVHSLSSTLFWLGNGAGRLRSIADYRKDDRLPSFKTTGITADELRRRIDETAAEAGRILAGGTDAHLAATVTFPEDPSQDRTGAACLISGIAHLREHVGHAQAVRDFWAATSPQNSWR